MFFAPENDHVCTRIEHVLHVATIAKSICLGLNQYGWNLDADMAFAIGLGHDLGHAPFGHEGEYFLNKRLGGSNAFIHEINSYRIVEHLANNGKGLNLTYAVRDGIISHNGESFEQYLVPDDKETNDSKEVAAVEKIKAFYKQEIEFTEGERDTKLGKLLGIETVWILSYEPARPLLT